MRHYLAQIAIKLATIIACSLQVTDVPLQDLPIEVKSLLETYAAKLNIHVVAQFVQNLIDAVAEAVPQTSNRQPAPKAKVRID